MNRQIKVNDDRDDRQIDNEENSLADWLLSRIQIQKKT